MRSCDGNGNGDDHHNDNSDDANSDDDDGNNNDNNGSGDSDGGGVGDSDCGATDNNQHKLQKWWRLQLGDGFATSTARVTMAATVTVTAE